MFWTKLDTNCTGPRWPRHVLVFYRPLICKSYNFIRLRGLANISDIYARVRRDELQITHRPIWPFPGDEQANFLSRREIVNVQFGSVRTNIEEAP